MDFTFFNRGLNGWEFAQTQPKIHISRLCCKLIRLTVEISRGTRSPHYNSKIIFVCRFIFWKTLNDAQTKFKGKFVPNGNGGDLDIDIEEYEAVVGEDEVELPMKYSGTLSGKSMSGRVGDKNSKSTFKLDCILDILTH